MNSRPGPIRALRRRCDGEVPTAPPGWGRIDSSTLSIMEVCPRDGWQNLPDYLPVLTKLRYVEAMLDAGVGYMQLTAFVNPKAVPQMKDAGELTRLVLERYPGRKFCALIPNFQGARQAFECGLREVSCVMSVSESHNRANINRTHEESLAALADIRDKLPELTVIPALATAFGCPFEGEQSRQKVLDLAGRLVEMGFNALELADTIGVGDPVRVAGLFSALKMAFPEVTLMAHMHDTRNNGIANSFAALINGAEVIHTALGGLGGCPFAPGASGNTATEDLVWLLERGGFQTGLDYQKLLETAQAMKREIPGNYSGHQITLERDAFSEALSGGADQTRIKEMNNGQNPG